MVNIYTDGRYLEKINIYYNPRYYRMALVLGAGLLIYFITVRVPNYFCFYLLRLMEWIQIWPTGGRSRGGGGYTNPTYHSSSENTTSASYTTSVISNPHAENSESDPNVNNSITGKMAYAIRRLTESAKIPTGRRTVSETKKKFVAARQQWKCQSCGCILPAWFEVDHIQRVERGGTNHPDNLVAMCRECHGKKTAFENL